MTLSHAPSTPVVRPKYIGGPWDGGLGPLEPPPSTMASICIMLRSGGRYVLEGFEADEDEEYPVDRAVFKWEVYR